MQLTSDQVNLSGFDTDSVYTLTVTHEVVDSVLSSSLAGYASA